MDSPDQQMEKQMTGYATIPKKESQFIVDQAAVCLMLWRMRLFMHASQTLMKNPLTNAQALLMKHMVIFPNSQKNWDMGEDWDEEDDDE